MVVKLASKSGETAWQRISILENAAEEEKKKTSSEQEQSQEQRSRNRPEDFGYERHYLYELSRDLKELEHFAQSNEAGLANIPAFLLAGDAGTGKTHLFCDITKQRAYSGLPTVLLLGGHFSTDEP